MKCKVLSFFLVVCVALSLLSTVALAAEGNAQSAARSSASFAPEPEEDETDLLPMPGQAITGSVTVISAQGGIAVVAYYTTGGQMDKVDYREFDAGETEIELLPSANSKTYKIILLDLEGQPLSGARVQK